MRERCRCGETTCAACRPDLVGGAARLADDIAAGLRQLADWVAGDAMAAECVDDALAPLGAAAESVADWHRLIGSALAAGAVVDIEPADGDWLSARLNWGPISIELSAPRPARTVAVSSVLVGDEHTI